MTTRKGFTLIEMLVAMVLMTILVALLFQTFKHANDVSRRTRGWIETHQNARSLFEFMERDLQGALLTDLDSNAAGNYFEMASATYPDAAGIVSHARDGVRLLSKTMNPGYADLAEIGYWLMVPDSSDVRRNRVGRYLDYVSDDNAGKGDNLVIADTSTDSVWDEFKSLDVVALGVTDLNLEYMKDDGTWAELYSTNWINSPDLTGVAGMVTAVRITAYITDSGGIFLYGKTRDEPFCGSGIKFRHTVLIRQDW
ncbi:type II secretion system protein J [Planctomycetota bacterium]